MVIDNSRMIFFKNVFTFRYIPESPRWFLSYGKKKSAWQIIENLGADISNLKFLPEIKYNKFHILVENFNLLFRTKKYKRAIVALSLVMSCRFLIYTTKSKFLVSYVVVSFPKIFSATYRSNLM